jgi:uncharacterized membrane protein HdeD (DUF308 family)
MTVPPIPLDPADRRRAAPWFIVEGGLLIVLGVVAAILPGLAGVTAAAVFGWVLILSGIFGLTSLMGSRRHAHLIWSIVSGVVALVVGALIVWLPLVGAVTLALFIAAYLLVDGLVLIGLGWDQRKRGGRRWPWLMVSGVVDVALAVLIAALGPLSDTILLGFVIALDLIVAGIALMALGLAARH